MPNNGGLRRTATSSPILGPRNGLQPPAPQDPAVRQMRLKVLYTFDENKTNCLARWPLPLDIRTAFLDSETQVGVIELKTCLQAIAAASPEIVAGLDLDYTVYAYDYSEYETPLVGQGMLSWILASASPTPGAPAQQSRTLVTGRIGQNNLGLFGGGFQETMEVKLRLVPVPKSKQSEYIDSMRMYRDISQMMPPGFDPQTWTTFLQQHPNFIQQAIQSRSQSPAIAQPGSFGIEQVQRLLNGPLDIAPRPRGPLSRTNSVSNADIGTELPRLPSPASSVASTTGGPKRRGRRPNPNPVPKTAKARRAKKLAPAPESTDPGYCTGDDPSEEGSRKRAKITQVDWSGKPELGKQSDSLRVAASTAASVRIHQPTAIRPGMSADISLDSQPRAPTPVADPTQGTKRPRLPMAKSSLGHMSQTVNQETTDLVALTPASEKVPELSPEKSIAQSSPADMASSPPEFNLNSTTHSSPRLPEFPHNFDDADFFNGNFDDLFGDDENRSLDDEDLAVAAQYSKRSPFDKSNLDAVDDTFLPPFPSQQAQQLQQTHLTQDGPQALQDGQDQQARNGQSAPQKFESASPVPHETDLMMPLHRLPPVPASDPVRPPDLPRSLTWSGQTAAHPASDIASGSVRATAAKRPVSRARSRRGSDMGGQSGHKRSAAIQKRLVKSIAKGEVPPYCDHCGAIETPTWRKAWAKIHSGSPEHVRISDEEGGIIAWSPLQTDSAGQVCLYRIVKKTLGEGDEGFKQMLLCNPCGMYLLTRRCMRPKEMWSKSQGDPDDKSRREPSGDSTHDPARPRSADRGNTNKSNSLTQPSSPSSANKPSDNGDLAPKLPAMRRSAASSGQMTGNGTIGGLDEASAAAALERAIKSSPHKFQGSQQAPIEIGDLTPRPMRRILFPSPTQSEKSKSSAKPSPESQKQQLDEKRARAQNLEKENHPPMSEDDLDRFFNDDAYAPATGPSSTPKSKTKYPWMHKTPTQSPSKSASKAQFRTPALPHRTPSKSRTPLGEFTPFTAHLNQLLSDATAASPNGGGIDFAALPSLRNTPNSSRLLNFDFSQLDSQDLISTDIPMPSSPPPWNFDSFDDEGGENGLWGDSNLPNTLSSPASGKHNMIESSNDAATAKNVGMTNLAEAVA